MPSGIMVEAMTQPSTPTRLMGLVSLMDTAPGSTSGHLQQQLMNSEKSQLVSVHTHKGRGTLLQNLSKATISATLGSKECTQVGVA